jgi:hypothetical protein
MFSPLTRHFLDSWSRFRRDRRRDRKAPQIGRHSGRRTMQWATYGNGINPSEQSTRPARPIVRFRVPPNLRGMAGHGRDWSKLLYNQPR